MINEEIWRTLAARRAASEACVEALRSIPAEYLRSVLRALEDFMEHDEEGIQQIFETALAAEDDQQ